MSHLRMLSLGLAHLLKGVEENAKQLEQQEERVAAELERATKSIESLHKRSLLTGWTHRQVRWSHFTFYKTFHNFSFITNTNLEPTLSKLK